MLISHRYKFVVVHIPKCAGVSIRASVKPYIDTELEQHLDIDGARKSGYYLYDYIWVVFVRNPTTRLFSWYNFIKNNPLDGSHNVVKNMGYEEFLDWRYPIKTCYDYVHPKKYANIVIGKVEDIHKDFHRIFGMLGCDSALATQNEGNYSELKPDVSGHKYYEHFFKKDIEYFGY